MCEALTRHASYNCFKSHSSVTGGSLDVTLTPKYVDGEATSIFVRLVFEHVQLNGQDQLLSVPTELASIGAGYLLDDRLDAFDDRGPLELLSTTESAPQIQLKNWKTTRPIVGSVHAFYTALPREVDNKTKNGPALDLRKNFGGLLGAGYSFLLAPPDFDDDYKVTVRWDLTDAPAETRATWTFGDGPNAATKSMHPSTLQATFFAVGELHIRAWALDESVSKYFGTYWLGTPPFDAGALSEKLRDIFTAMARFFQDEDEPYRLFLRYNPYFGSRTGTALTRSFTFSYDSYDDLSSPDALFGLIEVLSHEMVHNWAMIAPAEVYENWYPEGMAEYYCLVLPHRFGYFSTEEFLKAVNNRLLAYYTNPLVSMSNVDVSKLTWSTSNAQRLPYGRGFAYAIATNALIFQRSNETRSLDDVCISLIKLAQQDKRHGVDEYLSIMEKEVGVSTAHRLYEDMSSGKLVVPLPDSLPHISPAVRLVREDTEMFELGFDESSLLQGDGIVTGIKVGSRAWRAGLRNGDRLLNRVRMDEIRYDPTMLLVLDVERVDDEYQDEKSSFQISFRPRSWERVECYQYRSVGGNAHTRP